MLAALLPLLAFLGAALADDAGFVRDHGNLMLSRMDPILSPGAPAGHVHRILGTSSFSPTYSYENSLKGDCNTSPMDNDFSSYWTPQLYRKMDNGSLFAVPSNWARTYYRVIRAAGESISEFPPGFRMIAGEATRSTDDPDSAIHRAMSYACSRDKGEEDHKDQPGFPEWNCDYIGLRAQIWFPTCWDGVNNWLEGSKHVAYVVAGDVNQAGACPSTHPKRIMGLFLETYWKDDYPYVPGAPDFTMGWPQGFLASLFDRTDCAVTNLGLKACPILAPHVKDPNPGSNPGCFPAASTLVVDEDIGINPISELPGNNQLWGGSVAKVPKPGYVEDKRFTTYAAVPIGWTALGCIADPSGSKIINSDQYETEDMTPASCIAHCATQGLTLAGIEYGNQCHCADSPNGSLDPVPSGKCDTLCPGLPGIKGVCGGGNHMSVYKWTGSGTPTAVMGSADSDVPSTNSSAAYNETQSMSASDTASPMTSVLLNSTSTAIETASATINGTASATGVALATGGVLLGIEPGSTAVSINSTSTEAAEAEATDAGRGCSRSRKRGHGGRYWAGRV